MRIVLLFRVPLYRGLGIVTFKLEAVIEISFLHVNQLKKVMDFLACKLIMNLTCEEYIIICQQDGGFLFFGIVITVLSGSAEQPASTVQYCQEVN